MNLKLVKLTQINMKPRKKENEKSIYNNDYINEAQTFF